MPTYEELKAIYLEAARNVPFQANPAEFNAEFDRLLAELLAAKGDQ